MPKMAVHLEGDEEGVSLARQSLENSDGEGLPSLFLTEVKESPRYRLIAKGNKYLVMRPSDDKPLLKPVEGYTKESSTEAIGKLEHIAKWEQMIELDNPTGDIPRNAVKLVVRYEGEVQKDEALVLDCTHLENGNPATDGFLLEIELSDDYEGPDLFCALLDFSESFAIGVIPLNGKFLREGKEPIRKVKDEPIKLLKAIDGKPIQMYVPRDLHDLGITERKDVIKLIVSTSEFDAELLKQSKLEEYRKAKGTRGGRDNLSGTLDIYMDYTATREMIIPEPQVINDWFSKSISIITKAPKDIKKIS